MAGPIIKSLNELKQYILRKLGHPLHQIEITDDQLNDAINETFKDFTQIAYGGYNERIIPVKLLTGIQNYILPYSTMSVIDVSDVNMSMIGSSNPANLFSMNQFIAADLYRAGGVGKIDLLGYELINQMTSSVDMIFARKISFDYNYVSKTLHLHGSIYNDQPVFITTFQRLELDTTPVSAGAIRYEEENIYDERWFQKMCVAKSKLQWGINVGLKYQNSVLPNGGSINGQGIIDMAEKEIEKLELQLDSEYTPPIQFFMG